MMLKSQYEGKNVAWLQGLNIFGACAENSCCGLVRVKVDWDQLRSKWKARK